MGERCGQFGAAAMSAGLPQAGRPARLLATVVAMFAWGVLVLAGRLDPDPSGAGTHKQLGLMPCSTLVVTGWPCPSCGMTTAFSAFVHGRLGLALRAQVFGAVLAAACLLAALGATLTATAGVDLTPVLERMFVGRRFWLPLLLVLALGSWALKAWLVRG